MELREKYKKDDVHSAPSIYEQQHGKCPFVLRFSTCIIFNNNVTFVEFIANFHFGKQYIYVISYVGKMVYDRLKFKRENSKALLGI